ncbi:hypothetical protein [Streptomyces sp. NPDC050504]|uniref:hypothetical protein n=1 Tax=Streptomyces sp. NPDC050504 TaxID=3365618 RepID=UPI0037A764A9
MDSVPVSCPACDRAHAFVPASYPCACGTPVTPPLVAGAPAAPVTGRAWADEWVTVRCTGCGRDGQWPQPELGCPCGAVLRVPVARPRPATAHTPKAAVRHPAHIPLPRTAPAPRPAFRPEAIRTARDAITVAARYLGWLGYRGIVRPEARPASGADLRAEGLVAHVDPTTSPTTLRTVECLWLNGLSASAASACFSLAGYAHDAAARADELSVPLFVMDLTGTPRPVNAAAEELVSAGR